MPKSFVDEPFNGSELFGYRKFLKIRREYHNFVLKLLLSHSDKRFRCGTVQCFQNIRASETFLHKKGITLSLLNLFLSHSAKTICGEPFDVNFFCFTVPESFVGEPFKFSEIIESQTLLSIRRG